jgi:hypothetical protein
MYINLDLSLNVRYQELLNHEHTNRYIVSVGLIDRMYFLFDVPTLKLNSMYKDVLLITLDIPYSLPVLI